MSTSHSSSRNFIPIQNKYDRVVLLVDMDCFYCQVEEKLNPELKGQPLAVVQYNAWRGGGIIAVNYAARAKGVTRHMRGDEAKEQCPEIQLVKVPNVREKADLSKYRDAGKDVANVLQRFTTLLERASVDEGYLDITEAVSKRLEEMNAGTFVLQPHELINTYAVGYERIGDYLKMISSHFANPYADDENLNAIYDATDVPAVRQSDVRLLLGAAIASEIRAEVKKVTSYECSAGIAHNKILAKLACGMNKPNKQTILPLSQVERLFETLPVGKIKGLGAKYGEEVCERLKIRYLGQILKYTESELQKIFDEKNGSWLYYICRGIDLEAVTPRFYSKSISCCKKFPGRNNITGLNTLKHWLKELATEISERLEKDIMENNRKAKQMTVSYIQECDGEEIPSSRSVPLTGYDIELLCQRSLEVIKANTQQFLRPGSEGALKNPIRFLGISVGKFETVSNTQTKLQEMFANQASKKRKSNSDPNVGVDSASTSIEEVENPKVQSLIAKKEQRDQDKMKGFFAKYLQNQSNKKVDGKENSKDAMPAELNSFFTNAQNQTSEELKPVKDSESNKIFTNSSEAYSIENDDVLKLEAELKAIASEENIDGGQIEHVGNGSNGSPQRKKIKPSSSLESKSEAHNHESDYKTQYAEYAIPELCLDLLEFQHCEICGAKIPVEERAIQTHRDHHFAQELSQQQREEFRAELKSKVNQKQTSQEKGKNKSEKQRTRKTTSPKTSIKHFLKPNIVISIQKTNNLSFEEPEPQASTSSQALQSELELSAEEFLPCSECKMLIKNYAMEEHKDYHLAKQLQRELNKLEVNTVLLSKKTASSSSKKETERTKPITQFFTQSQTF